MGYEVHIVRTEDWLNASENPITKEDTNQLINTDKELSWSKEDYFDMKDESGQVTRYYAINWNDTPCFFWYKSQIRCNNPNKEQVIKMVVMSKALGARVIGDDGETYSIKKNILGKISLTQKNT
jgi:hypothetical protein